MILYFDRDEFITGINPLMGAVSNKNTSPAIEGIHLNALGDDDSCIVTSYDLEKGIRSAIRARVETHGSCIINAQRLLMITRTLPKGEFRLSVDDAYNASIDAGTCHFSLKALPGEDFPILPELSGERAFSMPQFLFRKFMSKVMFAIAQNDQRPAFNGAYFRIVGEKITVVSCDGNRLAICEKDFLISEKDKNGNAYDLSFIVPGKSLAELLKLVKDTEDVLDIRLSRKHVTYKIGDLYFMSKLIDADYINYERILPKGYPIEAYVDADDFRGAMERSSLIVEDRVAGSLRSYVKITMSEGKMNLSTISQNGSVVDDVPASVTGGDLIIGFNSKILLEAVRACGNGKLKICMSSPMMGISIEPTDNVEEEGKSLFFVMPLRMNG